MAADPDVPVEKLFKFIGKADYILLMSVFAGFGGQKFIQESLDRVRAIKAEIVRQGAKTLIEVDGGVTLANISSLKEAGVDIAVTGSTVFKAEDPIAMVEALRRA